MARARTRVFAPDRQKKEKASRFLRLAFIYAGNDLLSHTLSRAVQSALRGLTSVFGMGTGGSPAVRSPTNRSCQLSAVSRQLSPVLRRANVLLLMDRVLARH